MSNVIGEIERDLRGSLGTITGYAQLLAAAPLDAEQRQAVSEIRQAGDHLLGDLEMLFEYWRAMARASLDTRPFELTGAAMTIADLVAPRAAHRHIRLASPREVEPGNWVIADESLVVTALTRGAKLLVDALEDGGRLEIRLASADSDAAMRVSLEADGLRPGQPPLTPVARVLLDQHVRAAGGRFRAAGAGGHGSIAVDLPRAVAA